MKEELLNKTVLVELVLSFFTALDSACLSFFSFSLSLPHRDGLSYSWTVAQPPGAY